MASSNPGSKVYVKTLGCKVNTYDSKALENQFAKNGFAIVQSPQQADIQVINTCSVTKAAEREARYLIRRYKREHPRAKIVITGCYAQIDSENILRLDGVDLVVPNAAKPFLVDIVTKRRDAWEPETKFPENLRPVADNRQAHFKSSITLFDHAFSDRTRAFVKIQDGCNGFCSYCQIPLARGASISVPAPQVIAEVKRLAAKGVPEIVVTGIHVGDYGRDLAGSSDGVKHLAFVNLLRELFKVKELKRLRISSLEPSEISEPLLEILAENKTVFCDHFHLPLQSGSDGILKKMRRTYDSNGYRLQVELIRKYFPEAHISADVIAGFPGESASDLEVTAKYIAATGIHSLHVFPYSVRPNTAAERMPNHLPPDEKKRRVQTLRALAEQQFASFAARFLNRNLDVLWEDRLDSSGRRLGKTKNYINVCTDGEQKAGTISAVKLKGFVGPYTLLAT